MFWWKLNQPVQKWQNPGICILWLVLVDIIFGNVPFCVWDGVDELVQEESCHTCGETNEAEHEPLVPGPQPRGLLLEPGQVNLVVRRQVVLGLVQAILIISPIFITDMCCTGIVTGGRIFLWQWHFIPLKKEVLHIFVGQITNASAAWTWETPLSSATEHRYYHRPGKDYLNRPLYFTLFHLLFISF